MYKIHFPHGIMFHHFHDNKKHLKGQGSISGRQFEKIINFIGAHNISSPENFLKDLKKNDKKVCLTFDDSLKSQFDIAIPIMKKYNIKGYFFIYTSVLTKNFEYMEIYRFFRDNYFRNIDEFYDLFFKNFELYKQVPLKSILKKKDKLFQQIKVNAPFYSKNDITYRYLRDHKLCKIDLHKIMTKILKDKKVNIDDIKKKVFMNKLQIKKLSDYGHEIGLHSHSHPYLMKKLSKDQQFKEYSTNKNILKKITKKKIFSMSHPCGSFNNHTLNILKKLDINLGFKSSLILDNINMNINKSNLEIAREDHSNIMRKIK